MIFLSKNILPLSIQLLTYDFYSKNSSDNLALILFLHSLAIATNKMNKFNPIQARSKNHHHHHHNY
ncbi:MAG: hypothetical protein F6K25_17135 [Okeania sp. SIO2G4]|uniref:hypothetical protein n=1 Tax=unclassified Okeania TaxID=2634635 RepID=UPI0013B7EFA6|nr:MULTISPECIES: hypothetical protein [unclassified Okeania]NEP08167.1 hypothetical protein [Okeania sp. SIO4D6]NEP94959.1 hypothetical protein [Okeania sp. SIO2F5]NEQ92329.1 hypothetical protein [Okeania sp. SIO2G4]